MKIKHSFYLQDDVVQLAHDLIGKYLFTRIDEVLCGGYITETEAYAGIVDRASHAWGGRRTARTEIMYQEGGFAYVYLCYGIHSLFNIVTNHRDIPHAILIRGIYPTHGVELMLNRAGKPKFTKDLGTGPGKVSKILGISTIHNGEILTGERIWLEDKGLEISDLQVMATKRIGIGYAAEDSLLPYRFVTKQKTPELSRGL